MPDRLAAALADRYRLERELGRGGMATVYLAKDLKHKRRVGHWVVFRRGAASAASGGRDIFGSRLGVDSVPVTGGPVLQLGEPKGLFRVPEQLSFLDARFCSPWDVGPDGRFIMARSVDAGAGAGAPLVVVESWFADLRARVAR